MTLTPQQRQQLKAKAHALSPIIMIGNNGLTDAVCKEVDRALKDHELIKIKILSSERDERRAIIEQICTQTHAQLVQVIGRIGVIYRART